jgi:hypothetical protein
MGEPHPAFGLPELANDLPEGAEAIALFMFGTPCAKGRVYRLSTEVSPQFRLPTFKLGGNTLCARKNSILRWIERQEAARTTIKDETAVGRTPQHFRFSTDPTIWRSRP